jgi:hypothetical protein
VKREEEDDEEATAGGGDSRRTSLLQSAARHSHLKLKSATKRKRTMESHQVPSSSATLNSTMQHPLATNTEDDTPPRPPHPPATAKKPARKNARHVINS